MENEELDCIRRDAWITGIAQNQKDYEPNFVGYGSQHHHVISSGLIPFINKIIKEYGVTSINDAACGFFANWTHELELEGVTYTGFDIVPDTVKSNKEAYPHLNFYEKDVVRNVLPPADLVIARDFFFHLTNDCILDTLAKFKASNSKYLVATYHKEDPNYPHLLTENPDMHSQIGYVPRNLEISPFNLGEPLQVHYETAWQRYMGLWKL